MVRFGGQPEHGKGRLAQLVEHRLYTPAVTGSSPVDPATQFPSGIPHFIESASNPHSTPKTSAAGLSSLDPSSEDSEASRPVVNLKGVRLCATYV